MGLEPANSKEATTLLASELKLPSDIAAATFGIVTDHAEGFARDGQLDLEGFRTFSSCAPIMKDRTRCA